jgi:uncharacterized membrane protein
MQSLFSLVIDYSWLVPVAGLAFLAYRFLGWRGLLAILTFGLVGTAYTTGKRQERDRQEKERRAAADKARGVRADVEQEISNLDPGDKHKRLGRWMRDN